jgi:hypothetical protein
MMDYDSYKYVKNKITKEVNHLKDNLAYSVDNVNQLMYIRGENTRPRNLATGPDGPAE